MSASREEIDKLNNKEVEITVVANANEDMVREVVELKIWRKNKCEYICTAATYSELSPNISNHWSHRP